MKSTIRASFVVMLTFFLWTKETHALDAFPSSYTKKRVLISTDIGGGDKDDTQSMIHYLVYANMFDLEAIVISRPRGRIQEMRRVLQAYRQDYGAFLAVSPDYPSPKHLRGITKVGAKRIPYGKIFKTPDKGYSSATPGSRLIVKMARKKDPRPLYILCWGSTTDVAQAIHDAPDIRTKIRLLANGTRGYNYVHDPAPTRYLRRLGNLQWIDTDSTMRGIYLGGLHSRRLYGNVGFTNSVIKPRGALGQLFYEVSEHIDVNRYGIKMGDTPLLLFLMNGSFEDPNQPSWGGQYCKAPGAQSRYIDCPDSTMRLGMYRGAKSIHPYRVSFLKDWKRRLKLIYG